MTDTATLQERFLALEAEAQTQLVERVEEVHTSVLALLSGTHHFQLGEPGVAKSRLVRVLVRLMGLDPNGDDYFERLVTPFTVPEELFGVPSLMAMKNEDVYRRNTRGTLAEAKVAFLDEIWKGNSAILNSLLKIVNERLFDNPVPVPVPLATLFCASNELPRGEELTAMFDRIHIRHLVRPIREAGSRLRMLRMQGAPPVAAVTDMDDLERAKAEVAAVAVTDEVVDAVGHLTSELRAQSVAISDRRMAETLKVVRAEAWLDERDRTDVQDLRPVRHMLWTDPEDQGTVFASVLQLAAPAEAEACRILEAVHALGEELDAAVRAPDNDAALTKAGVEIQRKLTRAQDELEALFTASPAMAKNPTAAQANELVGRLIDRTLDECMPRLSSRAS